MDSSLYYDGNKPMLHIKYGAIPIPKEAADKIKELEARDVVSPEYLQSWIDRAYDAERQLDAVRELCEENGYHDVLEVLNGDYDDH